jgi:hypothetical protein
MDDGELRDGGKAKNNPGKKVRLSEGVLPLRTQQYGGKGGLAIPDHAFKPARYHFP